MLAPRTVCFAAVLAGGIVAAAGAARAADAGALLANAVALACTEAPGDAAAMAAALGAEPAEARPLEMGGQSFGWRRRFALPAGGSLRLTRIEAWDALRRIEAEYRGLRGGVLRPEMVAVAAPDCRIIAARRLVYDDRGRAEAIEILDSDFASTGERVPLNPPVPDGDDPGGVAVALIDSGVNYLLPEIAARLARDERGRILGYDYWDLDARPFDSNPARSPFFPERHGTRVASVILEEAPNARLIPYRYPRTRPARFADLIADAAASGARIVNMAMGSNSESHWEGFVAGIEAHPELLFVVSAGNDGRDLDRRPVYPAAYQFPNMLVVGSADGFGAPAPGSNWGKDTVDLLVPGEKIPVIDFSGEPTVASGASFAAPRVAALAARLLAANPEWTTAELKNAIIARARLVDGVGPLASRYGFLDLGR